MATGAGKTRTVIALADLLLRTNWVKARSVSRRSRRAREPGREGVQDAFADIGARQSRN